jgi:hypothetical protein
MDKAVPMLEQTVAAFAGMDEQQWIQHTTAVEAARVGKNEEVFGQRQLFVNPKDPTQFAYRVPAGSIDPATSKPMGEYFIDQQGNRLEGFTGMPYADWVKTKEFDNLQKTWSVKQQEAAAKAAAGPAPTDVHKMIKDSTATLKSVLMGFARKGATADALFADDSAGELSELGDTALETARNLLAKPPDSLTEKERGMLKAAEEAVATYDYIVQLSGKARPQSAAAPGTVPDFNQFLGKPSADPVPASEGATVAKNEAVQDEGGLSADPGPALSSDPRSKEEVISEISKLIELEGNQDITAEHLDELWASIPRRLKEMWNSYDSFVGDFIKAVGQQRRSGLETLERGKPLGREGLNLPK